MRRALFLAALAVFGAAASASTAAAQAGTCRLESQQGPWTAIGDPANRVISADGPLLVRCAAGEELRADSAVIYSNINEVHLFGRVDYQDPTRSLTSDRATYNSQSGRLYATGNVVFTDKNRGSTLRGPELEYFRAQEGRPESQAIATGRPHLTVVPRNEGNSRRREPMEIDGDRITSVGDRHMTAEGNVVIVSKESRSTAAEAYYDATEERVELRRQARVDGEKYDLSGDFIESDLQDGSVQKVLARTNARMESDRLTATGPQLQLFFERDLLQRMVASNEQGNAGAAPGRSVALSKGFRMEADSIEALSPEQQLRQVTAIGKAQGVSWDTVPTPVRAVVVDSGGRAGTVPADSNRAAAQPASPNTPPEGLDQKDVLTADTILAFFRQDSTAADSVRGDSAAADSARPGPRLAGRPIARPDTAQRDTTPETEIERLIAIGDARSLYRMRDDSVKAGLKRPALNYLIGDRIDLTFDAGEVDVAHVRGLKKGVYLDPQAQQATADSAGAQGGTGGANPGNARPAGRPTAPAGGNRPTPARPPATPPANPPATTTTVRPADRNTPAGGRP